MGFDFHDDGMLSCDSMFFWFLLLLLTFFLCMLVVVVTISACDIKHFTFDWIVSIFSTHTHGYQYALNLLIFKHVLHRQIIAYLGCSKYAKNQHVIIQFSFFLICHFILSVTHTLTIAMTLFYLLNPKKALAIAMKCKWGSVSWCVVN